MKKAFIPSLILAASAMSSSAAITLVAGWDNFDDVLNATPTHLSGGTTATLTSAATGGNWDDWNNTTGHGSSDDGTFGSLSSFIAAASTVGGTASNQGTNLSLNRSRKPGTLTFNLTNTSGLDRTMDGFYFDAAGRFAESAKEWTLSFSGAISGSDATGTLTQGNLNGISAADRDKYVDLTGLTDNVWEAGQAAIFTLVFGPGPASTSTGGGQETVVDNIGITANVVPEPSSLSLLGLGICGLLLRRRK
ncbi:PEP-CTERM sorting domain-containing protein [Akkermansiaceae bacterium]|nr:PEP-CTERM sorting domain-containing protein [Akkermansiaceae bacterium]